MTATAGECLFMRSNKDNEAKNNEFVAQQDGADALVRGNSS